jgi:hypothetical protein
MSNLTEKFTSLQELMTAQHNALMTALTDLRGTGGPETTLRSINQSIWNLAGEAPGASLVDLRNAITDLRGEGPENTVKSVNQSIWNLAGPAPGATLVELKTALNTLITAVNGKDLTALQTAINGVGNGKSLLDVWNKLGDMLTQAEQCCTTTNANLTDIEGALGDIANNTSDIANNTAGNAPSDLCESPITSTGNSYSVVSASVIEPYTVATWEQNPGEGFSTLYGVLSLAYSSISCNDWSQYRVYVESNADSFGLAWLNPHMYPCNEWITLPFNNDTFDFFVFGNNALKVYICPKSEPPLGGACEGATDQMFVTDWYHPTNEQQLLPLYDSWFALAWTGGGSWSELASFFFITDMFGFSPTVNGNFSLCVEWDKTNEPNAAMVGVHCWMLSVDERGLSGWSDVFVGYFEPVSTNTTTGFAQIPIDLSPWPNQPDIIFVPFVAFSVAHPDTPNMILKLSFIAA